jgi:hypothetical protein
MDAGIFESNHAIADLVRGDLVFGHQRLYISEASRTLLTTPGSVPSLNLNKTMCTIGILIIERRGFDG